jgi:hypothetical protein
VSNEFEGAEVSRKVSIAYILLGFMMVQYQNCAPQNGLDQQFEVAQEGHVSVINRIEAGDISFPQSKLQASAAEVVEARGVCAQTGALIAWKLVEPSGEAIEQGLAECDQGIFVVSLSENRRSFCDQDLLLKANLGAKASSQMTLETLCQ